MMMVMLRLPVLRLTLIRIFIFIIKTVVRFDIEEFAVEFIILVFQFLYLLSNLIFEVISDLDRAKLEGNVGIEFEGNRIFQIFRRKIKE